MAPFPEEVDVFTAPHWRMKQLVGLYCDKVTVCGASCSGRRGQRGGAGRVPKRPGLRHSCSPRDRAARIAACVAVSAALCPTLSPGSPHPRPAAGLRRALGAGGAALPAGGPNTRRPRGRLLAGSLGLQPVLPSGEGHLRSPLTFGDSRSVTCGGLSIRRGKAVSAVVPRLFHHQCPLPYPRPVGVSLSLPAVPIYPSEPLACFLAEGEGTTSSLVYAPAFYWFDLGENPGFLV